MSTTDIELLKQSLKILIDDFQTFKKMMYSIIAALVLFAGTAMVSIVIAVIS